MDNGVSNCRIFCEIVTETTCLAIVFRWNEISSEIFHFRYPEIQKESLNLGTNIRLPEIKYFTCREILTDILSFEAHFGNSKTINFAIDFGNL
jgi:hypothetical protein